MESKITIKRTYYRTVALLLAFVFILHGYKSYFHLNNGLTLFSILKNKNIENFITTGLLVDLLAFVFAVIILHLVWAYVIAVSCRRYFNYAKSDNTRTLFWFVVILLHFNFFLLLNSYLYPTSFVSIYRHAPMTNLVFIWALGLMIIYLYLDGLKFKNERVKIALSLLLGLTLLTPPTFKTKAYKPTASTTPNIILIGLDALRPDHLNYQANREQKLLPHINEFISKSVIYDKTYTPQPRTFVSWFSLLKSQYPNTHKGRFNLTSEDTISKNIPFLNRLHDLGYSSLYAIDERRFNKIDESFGFDKVVGPKIGFVDQLTNKFSDLPIINLVSHTRLGTIIFPFLYLNRANGKTFDYLLFNEAALDNLDAKKPNFFSAHLCMLHWPYTSKEFITIDKSKWQGNYNYFMYMSLLEKLDQQFEHLITNLKDNGYLDNAIVVVFSDHGDSFKLIEDALTPTDSNSNLDLKLNVQGWGHGTNVLDQRQANILLSYSEFQQGKQVNRAQILEGNFSILDIVPTLMDKLQQQDKSSFEGISLPFNQSNVDVNRTLFVNSAVPSESIDTSFIKESSILKENINIYAIDDNGSTYLTEQAYHHFIPKQHRSVYFQHWQLAYIPEVEKFILANLKLNTWDYVNDFKPGFIERKLLTDFCQHYKKGNPDLGINECKIIDKKQLAQSTP